MINSISRYFIYSFLLFIYFFVAISEIAAQHIGFFFKEDRKKISIPVEVHNNLVILPITLDDTYRLKFILDTGVRSTILINKTFADTIGINYTRKVELHGAGNGEPIDAFVTEPISLSLPGIVSSGISTLVLEKDLLQLENHLGTRIHGLVGYDIFSRFVVKINYIKRKVILFKPEGYSVPGNYDPIYLNIIDSKPHAQLLVQLDTVTSIDARLLIDTGASHALVLNQHADRRIRLPEKHINTSLGRSLSGEIQGYLGRIEGLSFGEKPLKGVIASFPQISANQEVGNVNRIGSVGGELLKKYSVIFDFPHDVMYVKSNVLFKHPFEYNMSGLAFIAKGKNLKQFVINDIRDNSAASGIGFKPGDILVSLNNVLSKELDLTKIYSRLNQREGKKINMTMYREGKYISRSFRLRREL